MSAAPSNASIARDSEVAAREAEDRRRGAEDHDGRQHLHADVGLERAEREEDRGERRAGRRSRAERSEAVGADLQDVAGIDRKHRGHAAEQDREQVEGDRAEHQPVAADIG